MKRNSVPQGPEMRHGVRGTSIYTIQTATNFHLPNQSAKTARFVHYLDELFKPERQELTWPSYKSNTSKSDWERLSGTKGRAVICRRNVGSHRPGMLAPQDGQQP